MIELNAKSTPATYFRLEKVVRGVLGDFDLVVNPSKLSATTPFGQYKTIVLVADGGMDLTDADIKNLASTAQNGARLLILGASTADGWGTLLSNFFGATIVRSFLSPPYSHPPR